MWYQTGVLLQYCSAGCALQARHALCTVPTLCSPQDCPSASNTHAKSLSLGVLSDGAVLIASP